MAQPRILYEDGRPYTVCAHLDDATLRRVWRQLWLPRKVRRLRVGRLRSPMPVA